MNRLAGLLSLTGVEQLCVLAGSVGFLAIHGGLEGGTDAIATAAAQSCGASLYAVIQPPHLRWHIPSHHVTPAGSSELGRFLAHVDVAVSIHGYGFGRRRDDILVGGANRPLAAVVASELRHHLPDVAVEEDLDRIPADMRGVHPANPANAPRGGGVQVELPPSVRGAALGRPRGDPCRPHPGVVVALVAAARRWAP